MGHDATAAALRAAARVFVINPADREGLEPLVARPHRLVALPAFLDLAEFSRLAGPRAAEREALAERHGLDGAQPWLLAVAMMRPGDKLASYRCSLRSAALAGLVDLPWQLLIVGDGPARPAVRRRSRPSGAAGSAFAGPASTAAALLDCYAAADLYVWPAVSEAWGMTLLEAQAAGLPVVAGAVGGVPAMVADGITGLLTPPGESRRLSRRHPRPGRRADPPCRHGHGRPREWRRRHDIASAARILDETLAEAGAERA